MGFQLPTLQNGWPIFHDVEKKRIGLFWRCQAWRLLRGNCGARKPWEKWRFLISKVKNHGSDEQTLVIFWQKMCFPNWRTKQTLVRWKDSQETWELSLLAGWSWLKLLTKQPAKRYDCCHVIMVLKMDPPRSQNRVGLHWQFFSTSWWHNDDNEW